MKVNSYNISHFPAILLLLYNNINNWYALNSVEKPTINIRTLEHYSSGLTKTVRLYRLYESYMYYCIIVILVAYIVQFGSFQSAKVTKWNGGQQRKDAVQFICLLLCLKTRFYRWKIIINSLRQLKYISSVFD